MVSRLNKEAMWKKMYDLGEDSVLEEDAYKALDALSAEIKAFSAKLRDNGGPLQALQEGKEP